jgi:hypothetical protein
MTAYAHNLPDKNAKEEEGLKPERRLERSRAKVAALPEE